MYLGNTPTLTIRTDFVFVATNGQTVFTGLDSNGLTLSYNTNNCDVFANGVLQQRIEYTTTSASTITLATPRQANDVITIRSYGVPANVDSIMQGKFETSNVGFLGAYRNKIINGDFDIWQRGLSQTASGYGSDDRWVNSNSGTTKTHSRQSFTAGQTDVPGNPRYFSRTTVTSVTGAANFSVKQQRIDNVISLSNKKITLTFYAKSNAARNIAVEIYQSYGIGGSTPDSYPQGLFALTTSWKKFTIVFNVPTVSGKTITDGSYTEINFWFDAGTNFASRASNLGQQSGTFDIAHVSVVEGDARLETDPFSPRHLQQELALCQRYYEIVESIINIYAPAVDWDYSHIVPFKIDKRGIPSVAVIATSGESSIVSDATVARFTHVMPGGGNKYSYIQCSVDAEI